MHCFSQCPLNYRKTNRVFYSCGDINLQSHCGDPTSFSGQNSSPHKRNHYVRANTWFNVVVRLGLG